MDNHLLVSELLNENFPVECEIVGSTNLKDLVDAEVTFESAESGSYMDLSATIGFLVVVVTFIKNAVDIYISLKKEWKRKPEKDEIEIRIVVSKEVAKHLDKTTRERLIKAVISKIENEK